MDVKFLPATLFTKGFEASTLTHLAHTFKKENVRGMGCVCVALRLPRLP